MSFSVVNWGVPRRSKVTDDDKVNDKDNDSEDDSDSATEAESDDDSDVKSIDRKAKRLVKLTHKPKVRNHKAAFYWTVVFKASVYPDNMDKLKC
eukprot:12192485-Ditylum_brightwellii.AAC.1